MPEFSCFCPGFSTLVPSLSLHTLASYSAWLGIVQAHLWLKRPCTVPDVFSQSGLSPLFCGLETVQSPCGLSRSRGWRGGELNGNLHRDQFQQISWTASPPLKEWDGGCEGGPQPAHQRSVPACQLWLLALHCTPLVPVIGVLAIFKGINI